MKIAKECGGQSWIDGEYLAGAPELIVEVSNTTAAKNAREKLRLYERSGVCEYIIVQPRKHRISWHRLADGKYQEIAADASGHWKSNVFPGLWLNSVALWNCDFPGLAKSIQLGSATPEHATFVRKLARNKY